MLGRRAASRGPLGVLMLIYAVVQLVGMGVYGVEPWTRRGDAFGVWFGLFALLAPIGRAEDGRLVLRPPFVAAARLRRRRRHGRAAGDRDRLDRLRRRQGGPAVQRRRARTSRTRSARWGSRSGASLELAFVVGLLVAIALVGALWWLGTTGMPLAGSGRAGAS